MQYNMCFFFAPSVQCCLGQFTTGPGGGVNLVERSANYGTRVTGTATDGVLEGGQESLRDLRESDWVIDVMAHSPG